MASVLADRGQKRSASEAGFQLWLDAEATNKLLHVTANKQLVQDCKGLKEELRNRDLIIELLENQELVQAKAQRDQAKEQRDILMSSMRLLLLPLTRAKCYAENGVAHAEVTDAIGSIVQTLDQVNAYEEDEGSEISEEEAGDEHNEGEQNEVSS